PGRYLWHEGMHVSDLIPSRDTLITREYWNAQNAVVVPEGQNEDGIGEQARSKREDGGDQRPRPKREDDQPEDLSTGIRRRSSEINWEYAVIERLNGDDLTTELIPFNLGNAIDQPSSQDNKLLERGDILAIFSQRDVPVATENRAKFVQISGEVKAPGVYRL